MKRIALLVVLIGAIGVPVASGLVNDKKKSEPDDPIMYVLPKGDIYHNRLCVTLRKSKTINEITLTDAALMGLKPCLRCSPPKREIVPEKAIQITVEKLLQEPDKFHGKRVQVKGTVAERTQTGGAGRNGKTALVVADGDKKITVFSNYGVLLPLNDQVVITGKFSKETSKIDATPITGKIEVQSKPVEKTPVEKKVP
ncbi:MAG: hypothetical protein HYR84_08540 [Planctomycetes bacterium]|nr:hypothetical protein [Planctomycetota bacterium]